MLNHSFVLRMSLFLLKLKPGETGPVYLLELEGLGEGDCLEN